MRSFVDSSNLGCSVRHLLGCQVTVDRAKNRTADTGGWELVYRQPLVQQPQYSGISLTVQGTKMHLSQRWAPLQHCSTAALQQGAVVAEFGLDNGASPDYC